MILEEDKIRLRPIFKLGGREWMRMFNQKALNAEELIFLCDHWNAMKSRMKPKQIEDMRIMAEAEALAKAFDGVVME